MRTFYKGKMSQGVIQMARWLNAIEKLWLPKRNGSFGRPRLTFMRIPETNWSQFLELAGGINNPTAESKQKTIPRKTVLMVRFEFT